nr:HlyD family efflux transporter periplasmic adaptor subunit [uncultured Tolumonas sp.]
MMATANLNLVHETEAQRRHARVKIPARLIVTDTQHNQYVMELNEISASGFSVINEDARLHVDQVYRGRLLFNFDAVEFVLKVNFKVIHQWADEHRFGCEFQDLGTQEISTLRLLISKFLGGEIAQVNDVLTTLSRENFTKARKTVKTSAGLTGWAKTKALLATALMFVVGLGAFSYLLSTLASHYLVTAARSASVTLPQQAVLMPKEGNVELLVKVGATVKAGMPVARVQAPWAEQVTTLLKASATPDPKLLSLLQTQMDYTLPSPCDCVVLSTGVTNGQFLERGKPVVQLVPPQSQPYVQANFDYVDYAKLTAGRKVMLTLPDGLPEVSGTISQVQMTDGIPIPALGAVMVQIKPDQALPASSVSSPVAVSVAPVWFDRLRMAVAMQVKKFTQTEAG